MKITKEMGRACLRELATGVGNLDSRRATDILIGADSYEAWATCRKEHFDTILAMCAAIAGVV